MGPGTYLGCINLSPCRGLSKGCKTCSILLGSIPKVQCHEVHPWSHPRDPTFRNSFHYCLDRYICLTEIWHLFWKAINIFIQNVGAKSWKRDKTRLNNFQSSDVKNPMEPQSSSEMVKDPSILKRTRENETTAIRKVSPREPLATPGI